MSEAEDTGNRGGGKRKAGSAARSRRALLLIFFALAAAFIAAGYLSYHRFARNFEQNAFDELTSIGDLRAEQLVQWRKERLIDASILGSNTLISVLADRTLRAPEDRDAFRRLESEIRRFREKGVYDRVRVLDRDGTSRLSLPAVATPVPAAVVERLPGVLRSGRPEIVDFFICEAEKRPFLGILMPVGGDGPEVVGALFLRIDPRAYLYPYLDRWPVPSRTAETYLVRRDGDDVLFLNETRFRKDAALKLRVPVGENTVAGRAVTGETGIVTWLDDHGKPVIAALRPIPDSPWFLVAVRDTDEVYGPIRNRFLGIVGIVGAFLAAIALALGAVNRRQKIRFLRERLKSSQHIQSLAGKQHALLSSLPEIIMEVDQNHVYTWANRHGLDFFGEDVLGREAAFYFEGEQDTYQRVAPIFEGFEDVIYVESWQRRKDGEKRLLGWWCRTLKDADGKPAGAISSARDITEERKAEETLRESEARYRTLIDNAPVAVFINRENRVTLVNDACVRLFGATSPEQLLGKTPFELFHPDYHEVMRERIGRLRDRGEVVPLLEEKIVRLDGSVRDVEVAAAPFPDRGVNAIHVVITDIAERKEAEARARAALEALKVSEERFRMAFVTSPDSININRMSDGMYLTINKGFTQATGYTEDDVIGKTSLEINVWADPEDWRRLVEGLRKDGLVENLEARFRRKNGEVAVGLMSATVLEFGGVPHILSITHDITQRKRAETALRESERKFRAIFENIQDVYYETSLDGTVLEMSPSVKDLFQGQYSREDLIGKQILDTYAHPEERETFLADIMKTGRVADYEIMLRNRDGSEIRCSLTSQMFFDASGKPEKIIGSIRDIDKRKKAEAQREEALAALRENEATFAELMKNSPIYMFFKDENIRAIRLSDNFRDLIGMPVAEALGKNMYELFPSEFAEKMVADDRKILHEGRQVTLDEDFNGRFYTTIKFPIKVEGKPRYLAGFTIDITERKQQENRIKEALEALRGSLKEKELLLQEVHHRVKNNMQIISSLFSLEAEHASPETREILKRGQTRIRSMSLVHEKLYRAADLSKIDLAGYIESLANHLFQVYVVDPRQVRLETDCQEVRLDINSAIPFGLLINELISNALKHAFPAGRKGVIRIRLAWAPGEAVILEVSDDGVGLPEAVDLKNPSGFGFQIINLLVEQLDAALTVERNEGTAFTLKFRELKYLSRI